MAKDGRARPMSAMSRLSTQKFIEVDTSDDPDRIYRCNEYFPGYAGHVPKLLHNFGRSYTPGTRTALKTPPAPKARPVSSYDQARNRRVLSVQHLLPGNSFSGSEFRIQGVGGENSLMLPDDNGNIQYLQGSRVDIAAYYTSLAARNYEQLLIKSVKARSNIEMGDRYYFTGPHMWQTTQKESFGWSGADGGGDSSQKASGTKLKQQEVSSMKGPKDKAYKYKVVQAVVGTRRLDLLEKAVRAKLRSLSGKVEAVRMFKMYDRAHTGYITPNEFLQFSRALGIQISATEATALFGRFDVTTGDDVTYDDFIDELLREGRQACWKEHGAAGAAR
ncbi:hypothetical protein T484DRAFT_1844740 [Baffinella frigidus]|nr:hypothetical protein T484DRAFT_1844740 [Cryptophyta sp. CCMP2293]